MIVEDVKILLVESDDILRAVYKKIIADLAKTVLTATNGEEGYEVYRSGKPDIIVTDVKLPIINGIDMVRKIRRDDKDVRVIIMSAFLDVKYFIQAIESSVKGFLAKPVDSEKFTRLLKEQIHEIILERQIKEEGRKRRQAEKDREKSDNILRVLSETTAKFFQQGITEENITSTLKQIGIVTNASRLYIFKKHRHKNIEVISQIYEWVDDGIESQVDNKNLVNIPLNHELFSRWAEILASDEIIKGNIATDFPALEKEQLEAQDIKSILVIPIFVEEKWWGFIGLDECKTKRQWSEVEVYALRLVANNIGAAFYRKKVELQLLSLNADLERRVKDRTKKLEIEVAERKHTEILLRESEEKYRQIFENANDGIVLLNNKGEVLLLNPRMVEVLGVNPGKVIGRVFCRFIDDAYKEPVKAIFSSEFNDDSISTIDVTITRKKDKKQLWLELKPTRINWDSELATLVFISDITLRRTAQNELNKLNQHLENRIKEEVRKVEQQQQLLIQKSKLESMGELAAGLAHEINQPLGGISMGLDNILFKVNEGELTDEYLINKFGILFKDIERIRNIINHVRIFSRDQQSSQKERILFHEVLQNALSLFGKQLKSNNIKLQVHESEPEIYLYGNPFRIEQVLLNLLSNAKYAVNEKEETIDDDSFIKEISISVNTKDNTVLITVEDNGTGMPEDILNKIFDPFFTTKDVESGTGIGLSISYGIVKEMNGRIFAQSTPGKGTKMYVELPKF